MKSLELSKIMINLSKIKNSACGPLNKNIKSIPKISKEKIFMQSVLSAWCIKNNLVLSTEHKFHPVRKWRFDWSVNSIKLAIEYEGVFSSKSRHTTLKGYSVDTDKYRAAVILGWRVLRYTAINCRELENDLKELK